MVYSIPPISCLLASLFNLALNLRNQGNIVAAKYAGQQGSLWTALYMSQKPRAEYESIRVGGATQPCHDPAGSLLLTSEIFVFTRRLTSCIQRGIAWLE